MTPAVSGEVLFSPVEFPEIMPAVLLASIAVVWLNAPTTLCGRFEGLDHLISEPAPISTAFGTNIFTSARTKLDLAVSVMTRSACCATCVTWPSSTLTKIFQIC